jgi:hypothetical protein
MKLRIEENDFGVSFIREYKIQMYQDTNVSRYICIKIRMYTISGGRACKASLSSGTALIRVSH